MPVRIYVHLTWTTFARLPLIDAPVAEFLPRFLSTKACEHGARLIEVGLVCDHVHLVLELAPTFDIPRLVQGLKGASARIANRDGVAKHESLRWAQGYDLRSVGPRELDRVVAYVRNQKTRHASASFGRPIEAEPPL
jgi:putative transposase